MKVNELKAGQRIVGLGYVVFCSRDFGAGVDNSGRGHVYVVGIGAGSPETYRQIHLRGDDNVEVENMNEIAIIETTGTQTEVDRLATETLGFIVHATQGGRLGLELCVPALRADAVRARLIEAGLDTIVTVWE